MDNSTYFAQRTKERKISLINISLVVIFVVLFDQITKILVVRNMGLNDSKPLIEDVFELHYIQNTGSAWGMFSGKTIILTIVSLILMGGIVYVLWNLSNDAYYRSLRLFISMIMGGAIGNMIDRIRLGYVVDFLYFKLINFPVFNVADIFVTVPIIIVVLLVILKYHGNDFDVMLGDKLRLGAGLYMEKKVYKEKLRQGASLFDPEGSSETESKKEKDSENE